MKGRIIISLIILRYYNYCYAYYYCYYYDTQMMQLMGVRVVVAIRRQV
jgi:hypothetical protein